MPYQQIQMPSGGEFITINEKENRLNHPTNPIIAYIEGDGIGPDITRASKRIWDAAVKKAFGGKRKIHWVEVYAGEKAAKHYQGNYFPDETLDALKECVVSIKGPLTTPVGGGFRSLNVSLRKDLDLYACVRPVRYYRGVPSPLREPQKVDVVIFRENTEDVYAGIEYAAGTKENQKLDKFLREEMGASFFEGSGLGIKPMSAFGTKRLVAMAIRYAKRHRRESVTIVHKGNIMKYTEGAFRSWGYEVARELYGDFTLTEEELYSSKYGGKVPDGKVVLKDRIADIMFQLMLLRPEEFEVIATPNLNGDYLSDAIAAEVGGVGIAPGANMSDHIGVFEATHGTAPKYAGLDKANPSSLLLSGVMMLGYIGMKDAGDLISAAYQKTIADKIVTYDFARQMEDAKEVSTSQFADAIIEKIEEGFDLNRLREEQEAEIRETRKTLEKRRVTHQREEAFAAGRRPLTAGDLMSRDLVTISSDSTVDQVMGLMTKHNVGSVLVQPEGNDEWGIVTQTDILRRIVNTKRQPPDVRVGEITSRPLITIPRNLRLHDCSRKMIDSKVRRLVVFDRGKPVGVVADIDILDNMSIFGWEVDD